MARNKYVNMVINYTFVENLRFKKMKLSAEWIPN